MKGYKRPRLLGDFLKISTRGGKPNFKVGGFCVICGRAIPEDYIIWQKLKFPLVKYSFRCGRHLKTSKKHTLKGFKWEKNEKKKIDTRTQGKN